MPDKQPITIQRGSFTCTIYEIGKLMELPLANLRKLWKIMFSAPWENTETIDTIRAWLPTNTADAEKNILVQQGAARQAASEVESLRRTVAAFGSVATTVQKTALIAAGRKLKATEKALKTAKAYHARSQKLQTIFIEMSTK